MKKIKIHEKAAFLIFIFLFSQITLSISDSNITNNYFNTSINVTTTKNLTIFYYPYEAELGSITDYENTIAAYHSYSQKILPLGENNLIKNVSPQTRTIKASDVDLPDGTGYILDFAKKVNLETNEFTKAVGVVPGEFFEFNTVYNSEQGRIAHGITNSHPCLRDYILVSC